MQAHIRSCAEMHITSMESFYTISLSFLKSIEDILILFSTRLGRPGIKQGIKEAHGIDAAPYDRRVLMCKMNLKKCQFAWSFGCRLPDDAMNYVVPAPVALN